MKNGLSEEEWFYSHEHMICTLLVYKHGKTELINYISIYMYVCMYAYIYIYISLKAEV